MKEFASTKIKQMGKTMNHVCVYDTCLKSQKDTVGISFFKFPVKDLKRTRQWQKNCGNKHVATMDVHNLKNLLICESHFLPMYILVNNRRKLLSKVAVPIKCYAGESSDTSDNETSTETRRNIVDSSRIVQNIITSRSASKLDETNNDKLKVNVTNLKTYKAKPKSAATKNSIESIEIPLQETPEVQKHEDDSLYHFFMSGYHATRVLPKHVQCRIKNKISGIIFEEERRVFADKTVETNATSSLNCDNFVPFVQKIEKDDAIEIN